MPCKRFLSQLAGAQQRIAELGAGVVAVGRSSEEQAGRLQDRWVPYPCLVDPDGRLYRALGVGRFRWNDLVEVRTLGAVVRRYARGFADGVMQGRPSTTGQLPGVAVVDADARLRYRYAGTEIGDYPPVEEVLDALRRVVEEDASAR